MVRLGVPAREQLGRWMVMKRKSFSPSFRQLGITHEPKGLVETIQN